MSTIGTGRHLLDQRDPSLPNSAKAAGNRCVPSRSRTGRSDLSGTAPTRALQGDNQPGSDSISLPSPGRHARDIRLDVFSPVPSGEATLMILAQDRA